MIKKGQREDFAGYFIMEQGGFSCVKADLIGVASNQVQTKSRQRSCLVWCLIVKNRPKILGRAWLGCLFVSRGVTQPE